MAGSKKGEHRGGAKPGRKSINLSKQPLPKGRPPGSGNKSKFNQALGVILNKKQTPLSKEQELEMYFLVIGERMRLPKEVMLDAMRYFEETGISWAETVRANMPLLAAAQTPEEREPFERAIEFAEARVREHILMAVDVAYKAAPYIHPRLAAVITNPGSTESPLNILATLFKDLDEAGRPARYIDHVPSSDS